MQIVAIPPPPVRPISPAVATAVPTASPTVAATSATTPRVLNPNMHLDPGLGIVVTEYFNALGDETQQFPTEKAIQRYQLFGLDAGTSAT